MCELGVDTSVRLIADAPPMPYQVLAVYLKAKYQKETYFENYLMAMLYPAAHGKHYTNDYPAYNNFSQPKKDIRTGQEIINETIEKFKRGCKK